MFEGRIYVGGSVGHALQAAAHVAQCLGALSLVAVHCNQCVSDVDKRIPLIVSGAVGTHPRSHGFLAFPVNRLRHHLFRARASRYCRRRQLKVVGPVVLLVEIRRHGAYRLAVARVCLRHIVCHARLSKQRRGKSRVERFKHLCAESERRAEFRHRRSQSAAAVLVFSQSRWATDARVYRSVFPRTPSIVGHLFVGQSWRAVVAVVGNLV